MNLRFISAIFDSSNIKYLYSVFVIVFSFYLHYFNTCDYIYLVHYFSLMFFLYISFCFIFCYFPWLHTGFQYGCPQSAPTNYEYAQNSPLFFFFSWVFGKWILDRWKLTTVAVWIYLFLNKRPSEPRMQGHLLHSSSMGIFIGPSA